MIRIHRPTGPPPTLESLGSPATEAICTARNLDSTGPIRFHSEIYGAVDVKRALIRMQHGKCCFCERKIYGDGDVEHFRPKAGVSQGLKTQMFRPGYYWLAYEWSNLLLCCSPCNSRNKRNLFPLVRPGRRIRHHTEAAKLSQEEPLFVDPSLEDPTLYIAFDGPVPYPLDDNPRGRETIWALGLDREALNQIRGDYLNLLQQVRGALRVAEKHTEDEDWRTEATKLRSILMESRRDEAEFAGMARSAAATDYRDDG